MVKVPETRASLQDRIARQIEDGCKHWKIEVRTQARIVIASQELHLGHDGIDGVNAVVARLIAKANEVRGVGHKAVLKPLHTAADDRVSLCVKCNDRPGEARVDTEGNGKKSWVCGRCVPLTDEITAALREEGKLR